MSTITAAELDAELDRVRDLGHTLKSKPLDQLATHLTGSMPAFERMCSRSRADDMSGPEGRQRLLEIWLAGVEILDAISLQRDDASLDELERRCVAGMSGLATTWLAPRFEGEPRPAIRDRIANLRPVEQNERQQDLCEKNSEGSLTVKEWGELQRTLGFFDTLQSILGEAIRSNFPRKS